MATFRGQPGSSHAGRFAVCRHGDPFARHRFYHSIAGLVFAAVLLAILFGTVFAAVRHAELIAERVGEPFGTLLLTLAVTVIEVVLIATRMLGQQEVPTLARETVFAVGMIACNELVGACILVGGLRAAGSRNSRSPASTSIRACSLTVFVTITPVPGLPSRDVALLVIMMPVSMMRLGTGRTNIPLGLVHLVVFAIFLLWVSCLNPLSSIEF